MWSNQLDEAYVNVTMFASLNACSSSSPVSLYTRSVDMMIATRFQFMCLSNDRKTALRSTHGATTRENVSNVRLLERVDEVHPVDTNGTL